MKMSFAASGFLALALALPAWAHTPDPAAGKALYSANCSSCHLQSGAGGMSFGSIISADLRAPGLEATYHKSDVLLLRAILQGKDQDGETLNAPMPVWSGQLSPAQAADIIAYLKTLHS